MDELARRASRAAESILENESLMAELDDATAKVLLGWGISCAKRIAQSTAGLSTPQAEETMSPRLRATRRLIRRVSKWSDRYAKMDVERSTSALNRIIKQAEIVYERDFAPLDGSQHDAFMTQCAGLADPGQAITHLRTFIETLSAGTVPQQGGTHDQEID